MRSIRKTASLVLAMTLLWFLAVPALAQDDATEFVFGRMVDSTDLDPQTGSGGRVDHRVTVNIFEPLLLKDIDTGEFVPVLATGWELIDELTWEFTLREGVTFHNGEPFNAEAVKFSFDRVMDPEFETTDKFPTQALIDRVEIVDDYTVRVITQVPVPVLLSHLTRNGGFIIAPEYYADISQSQASSEPIGTGPFRFVSWDRDDRIVMEAYDDYWRGRAEIDRLVYRTIPEAATRVAELTTGGVHAIMDVPPDFIPDIEAAPNARVVPIESDGRKHMGINQEQHEALKDPRVRLAIQHAVDVEKLIDALQHGLTSRMATMVNPPNDHPDLEPLAYDPELARELLAEAGYPDGFTIELGAGREDDALLALAVAQELEAVGIEVSDVKTWEWGQYVQLLGERTLPALYVLEYGGAENTPETDMWAIHPDRQTNSTNWHNQEWVDAYAELARTFDTERRQELNYRLQEIMREDNPWLWLWSTPYIYGLASNAEWQPPRDDMPRFYEARVLED